MSKKSSPQASEAPIELNLEMSLAARRQRAHASWESNHGVHKRRFFSALDQHDQVAATLSQDVASVLASAVDELATHSQEFRTGMNRVFLRVLRMAREHSEQVMLFNEAVPGFMLMLFKKNPQQANWGRVATSEEAQQAEGGPELAAAGRVISQFVQRTKDRVLTVETDDALFVFLPASDIKKNLKEMGLYITE